MKIRQSVLWAVTFLIAFQIFTLIKEREDLLNAEHTIFLELAPVDPRAILQGDYMTLRYAMEREIPNSGLSSSGALVVRLDNQNVAHYVRVYREGASLADGEILLQYDKVGARVQVGPDAFFFEEGTASEYSQAEYAELRVDSEGNMILVGLRGPNFEVLGD